MQSTQAESNMSTVRDWMKKGDKAEDAGQRVLAISYWKQALAIDPDYAPAQRKIDDENRLLAKKEFETGYIHYHHNELEDALDSWSNAIALDPTYKERGLLLLMSKVELQIRDNQISRLAAQGYEQYQQGQLESALESYQDLTKLEPRNEEARRMTAKIKIQMGQAAFKAAQTALTKHAYSDAVDQADIAIQNEYEISRSSAIKVQAEHAIQVSKLPKPKKQKPPVAVVTSTPTAPAPTIPAAPTQPANPEAAMEHYRQGMTAIRKKDFHLALDELDAASKLDPSNERIYMARERARQEWDAANAGRTNP
jgi:tetratricopeptide (TPR) repeat protein